MKEGKQECAKPQPPPKPNLKNKDFVKWSKGESCKKEDNIVSTDWHERLQRTQPFIPVYDNAPLNMVYLLSGEYGRIWQKERDEWYAKVFVLNKKDQELDDRKKRVRKAVREAKKAALLKVQERKEQRAKEAELKAKLEAEKAEKLKAKLQKCAAKKKKKQVQKSETPLPPQAKEENCPQGWTPVELTVQCECSDHQKKIQTTEEEIEGKKEQVELEKNPQTFCQDYVSQLTNIHKKKENESNEENISAKYNC